MSRKHYRHLIETNFANINSRLVRKLKVKSKKSSKS